MVRACSKRIKNLGLGILVLLLVPVLAVGCGQGGTEPGANSGAKSVKVGIIDTYSGPAAGYSEDSLDGFKLALQEVKEKGNLGIDIEFVTRDDEFKVDKGLEWTKELVQREQVDILAGTINSATALAISEYAKEQKIPFLVWNSQSEKITGEKGHRYVFGMMPNAVASGRAGAVGMADQPYTKYWLAGSDYEYGHSIIDNFWHNIQTLNSQVEKLGDSFWPVGEADFTPYFNAIRAAKPDALVIGAGGADMVPVMKAIAATGLNNEMAIWIHTGTDLRTLTPLGLEAPEGVMGTATYHYYYPDTPENKDFVDKFREAYGREPGFTALNGYVTGHFIAAAIQKAGEFDQEKFVDALEGLTLPSPVGEIKIREYDHQVIAPMFFGTTGKEPGKEYLVSKEIITLSGEEIAPSLDDVKKARGE